MGNGRLALVGAICSLLAVQIEANSGLGSTRTPYTTGLKRVAEQILKEKNRLAQLDSEHRDLWIELGKIAILNSGHRNPDHWINDRIEIANFLDRVVRDTKAVREKNLGEAARVFGEQSIDLLIDAARKTNPLLALKLEALVGVSDGTGG